MYKTGKCKDCDYYGSLIAGRCKSHYWAYRSKVKEANRKKDDSIAANHKTNDMSLKKWFEDQIKQAPRHCEECSTPLAASLRFIPTAIIAHIFPKREVYGFPAVATHELNRMFFCIDCHTNYDNLGSSHVIKMKSFKLIKFRARKVYNSMTEEDQIRAAKNFDYLLD